MAHLSSKLAALDPFARHKRADDSDDEAAQHICSDSFGAGSSSRRPAETPRSQLRISRGLRSFLARQQVLPQEDADEQEEGAGAEAVTGALRSLIEKPHIEVPPELLDPSHPLPEYFISSSHNTYLLARQLYGTSSASAYETALKTGSRCVEIDAWDNEQDPDEPKVTHGFTLVSHVPFRQVCETIRVILDQEVQAAEETPSAAPVQPIFISLEDHCGAHGQRRLVEISQEVFGERLLAAPVRPHAPGTDGSGQHVPVGDIGPMVVFMIEFHLSDERQSSDSESGDSYDEQEVKKARQAYKERKKAAKEKQGGAFTIPELAKLGVYAQSVKPANNSWFDPGKLVDGPHHHLINISESGLASHLPANAAAIARHNSEHLMRVYPKGTRINSSNLEPMHFWAVGAQICALNWQTFGISNQLNAALFDGSEGYLLKPAALRAGGSGNLSTGKKRRLRVHVGGATDIPVPQAKRRGAGSLHPYVTCTLYHPEHLTTEASKRKTQPYKLHQGENADPVDPVWDEVLEWEYDENELVFLRMSIKGKDMVERNPLFAVAAVRLLYVVSGWTVVRMLDTRGRESRCTLVVKFDIQDA